MAMRIARDDLWLCVDCMIAAVNGDVSGIESEARVSEVWAGLERLGPHLSPDFDSNTEEGIREFSRCGCDACLSPLAGAFYRFATLEPVPPGAGPFGSDPIRDGYSNP